MSPTMTPKDLKRFTRKYINTGPGGCWLWMNGKHEHGYGVFYLDGKQVRAHRAAYEHYIGPIADGQELDHLCRVRGCVNPAHLEPVSHAENVRRGNAGKVTAARQRAKTHCAQGHEYTEANTYRTPDGRRNCRTCHRDRQRAAYHARKAVR